MLCFLQNLPHVTHSKHNQTWANLIKTWYCFMILSIYDQRAALKMAVVDDKTSIFNLNQLGSNKDQLVTRGLQQMW